VHAQNLKPHPKGATFDIVTTARDALGLLWEAQSRMLCRGVKLEGAATDAALPTPTHVSELTRWTAPADIGRRYARVSGDNPIHLSALTAKLFGFPRPSPTGCGTPRAALPPWANTCRRPRSR
jgi:acyl dehydratase